jgi:hypothetical protein
MTRFSQLTLAVAMVAGLSLDSSAARAGCTKLDDQQAVDAWAEKLRAEGPAGLAEVLRQCDELVKVIETYAKVQADPVRPATGDPAEQLKKQLKLLHAVADQVAGQRGASVSRLYWYADLAAAREAAVESGKPILSLRMLGKLTDEYSCANSRFFRTALYANRKISDYLRENYILHWQSVRPAPRITVDFGDGRKLERTITGNSAHYVLDATGRPLEALPGLYGPKAFQAWLVRSKELADRLSLVSNREQAATLLTEHHASRRNAIDAALEADLKTHAPELLLTGNSGGNGDRAGNPNARQAAVRAVSKTAAEAPLLASILPGDEVLQAQDDELWKRIAAAHADDARLDEASVAIIRRENPTAADAGIRAESKRLQEDPLVRLLRNFEQSMALDTVKNEYLLHRKIHEWYVNQDVPRGVDAFNEKVYAELFLTPSSDPWLGLAPADAYTALERGGLTAAKYLQSQRSAIEANIDESSRELTARR